jgi:hypothetical protein
MLDEPRGRVRLAVRAPAERLAHPLSRPLGYAHVWVARSRNPTLCFPSCPDEEAIFEEVLQNRYGGRSVPTAETKTAGAPRARTRNGAPRWSAGAKS